MWLELTLLPTIMVPPSLLLLGRISIAILIVRFGAREQSRRLILSRIVRFGGQRLELWLLSGPGLVHRLFIELHALGSGIDHKQCAGGGRRDQA